MKSHEHSLSPFIQKGGELSLSGPALIQLLDAVLGKGKSFRFEARGSSMFPFIRDGDIVTVSPCEFTNFGFGEIAAFRGAKTDHLIIHRIIGKQKGSFVTKGDNASSNDGLVLPDQILGRAVKIERSGRNIKIGLGPERILVALLSRFCLLRALLIPVRKCYRMFVPRTALISTQ